jgi:diguanylate cyclase (GGDEF)-like protein/PAS domain S-box-containing protein
MTTSSTGQPPAAWRWPLCAFVVAESLLTLAYFAGRGHDLTQAVVFICSSLLSVVAVVAGIVVFRPARRGMWRWLACGQALYLVGWCTLVPTAMGHPLPFPSYGDALYLGSYAVTAVALMRFIRARGAGADRSALLDALVTTVPFTGVLYVFVIGPTLAISEMTWAAKVVAVAYPAFDVVLLALVSRLLLGAGRLSASVILLAGWAATQLVGDLFYGIYQVSGTFANSDWTKYAMIATFVFIGAAALHPTMRDMAQKADRPMVSGRGRVLALSAAGLTLPVLAIYVALRGQRTESLVLACAFALMLVLLMMRVADLVASIVSASRREQNQLRESEERMRQFLEAVPIGVTVLDANSGEPAYVNSAAKNLLGYDPQHVASFPVLPNLYLPGTDDPYPHNLLPTARALNGESAGVDDVEVGTDGGQRRRLLVVGTPILEGDQLRYAMTAFRDITTEFRMAEELHRLSIIDELTGINNRRGFLLQARDQLVAAGGRKHRAALLYLDLDGLKAINDNIGHNAGDQAIRDMAEVLRASTRQSDLIGRMGGDEFCVLLMGVGETTPEDAVLSRLQELAARFNATTEQPYRLAYSVGVATFDPHQPCTLEEFMARADAAMYAVKRLRRARVE